MAAKISPSILRKVQNLQLTAASFFKKGLEIAPDNP